MEQQKENGKTLEYEVYLDERKLLVDAIREGARSFDKAILTLSAGAFGLSLAFVKQIAPTVQPRTIILLITSWVLFAISILVTLISFLTSQSACRRQIEILESKLSKKDDHTNTPAKWTDVLNITSIIMFVIGVVFLSTFAISNLREGAMSDKKTTKEDRGYVPQEVPKPLPTPEKIDGGFVPPMLPKPPPPPKEEK